MLKTNLNNSKNNLYSFGINLNSFSEKQIKSGNKILYPCLSEAFVFCRFVAALLGGLLFANPFEQYCL
jgi:hypothetical protein